MRHDVRFRNGIWVIFDQHRYEPVRVFSLERDANDALKRLKNR